MKNTTQSTFYNTYHTIDVIEQMQVKLNIKYNPYDFELSELLQMAARKNKKRSFLFVSQVLGKHLPISPIKGLATGMLLAENYYQTVTGEKPSLSSPFVQILKGQQNDFNDSAFISEKYHPIIIGFAETATALGQAFFQAFTHADYFHTTRETLFSQQSIINFEEEHSHATSHRCYIDEKLLQNRREIILVDDEVTTGKTARNIITSLHENYPRENYTVVSILDWRSEEDKRACVALEEALGINIRFISLVAGEVDVYGEAMIAEDGRGEYELTTAKYEEIFIEKELPSLFHAKHYMTMTPESPLHLVPYIAESGRFGLNSKDHPHLKAQAQKVADVLNKRRHRYNILCLGTGEFMYLPMKVASLMGQGVKYQSTTRSPIHIFNQPSYGARFGIAFPNPELAEIENYVYNIPPDTYEEVFVFFERLVDEQALQPLLQQLQQLNIDNTYVVYLKGVR